MRRVYAFTIGIGCGILACLAATNFHVVRAQDGFHLVQKQDVRLGQAYVDTRQFSDADWAAHPELIASLRADNEQKLVIEASPGFVQRGVNRLTAAPQQPAR